ncbi:MAG: Unknown protein [uncultured Sulfurovum sp.]|uniref:Uncharacterized protein n=1 Tax=uncultured Sulfurovum sp. TaxID=269237 RepID=A0A6S6TR40_9BACT|nr:MAG: Unknown protein [uncultured Sulfurovum sp.]
MQKCTHTYTQKQKNEIMALLPDTYSQKEKREILLLLIDLANIYLNVDLD